MKLDIELSKEEVRQALVDFLHPRFASLNDINNEWGDKVFLELTAIENVEHFFDLDDLESILQAYMNGVIRGLEISHKRQKEMLESYGYL